MYKQLKDIISGGIKSVVLRLSDNASIPFDPANTDYQKFKSDVLTGAELQNADGNVMTKDQVKAFIADLP